MGYHGLSSLRRGQPTYLLHIMPPRSLSQLHRRLAAGPYWLLFSRSHARAAHIYQRRRVSTALSLPSSDGGIVTRRQDARLEDAFYSTNPIDKPTSAVVASACSRTFRPGSLRAVFPRNGGGCSKIGIARERLQVRRTLRCTVRPDRRMT
jgi:hypothetical protein